MEVPAARRRSVNNVLKYHYRTRLGAISLSYIIKTNMLLYYNGEQLFSSEYAVWRVGWFLLRLNDTHLQWCEGLDGVIRKMYGMMGGGGSQDVTRIRAREILAAHS